jgi:CheY-like chemotaxis protein
MHTLPTFFYPSTTVWVDDDTVFLEAISHIIEPKLLKTFVSPTDCLHFFNSSYSLPQNLPLLRGLTEDERYDLIDHSLVDLNVLKLHQIHFSSERLKEVSIIIVDYKMLEMKGIDLCKKLQSQPAKKILLTGMATHEEAIEAFNSNVIDRFIRKDSRNLVKEIESYLCELSQEYFSERTKSLLSHLEVENKLPLSDPIFIKFFQELCITNSIKEYYLIDKNGSLMMINDKNQFSYLIIHTDRSLDAFNELNAEFTEANLFLTAIKNRQKIPHFGIGKEGWEFEISNWLHHFYTPRILQGREKYYYLISN